jgi:multiple sugar transport system substrate-binding protein
MSDQTRPQPQSDLDVAAAPDAGLDRRAVLRAGVGAVAAAAAATAGLPQAQPAAAAPAAKAPALLGQAKTVLTWATPGNPAEVAVYQALADTYMSQHPEIEIRTDREATNREKLVSLIAAGAAPDISFSTIDGWPSLAVKDVFLPLDEFIAGDEFDLDDFYPQIIKPYRYDGARFGEGALYGLPKEIAIRSMYFNGAIFDEAGIEPPAADAPWSWERFVEVTEATTKREGNRTIQYGYVQEMWMGPWMIWAWSAGGEAVDDPYNPTRSTLDDPRVLEGFQIYTDFVTNYRTAPTAAVVEEQGRAELFAAGRAATYNNGRWMAPLFRAEADFPWDVMPMPAKTERAQLLTGSIFAISGTSANPEAAWDLLSYITGPEGQTQLTELGLLLPSRRSIAESEVFLGSTPPEANQIYLDELEFARTLPLHPAFPEMEQVIDSETDLVLLGEKSAADALAVMHDSINALLQSQT